MSTTTLLLSPMTDTQVYEHNDRTAHALAHSVIAGHQGHWIYGDLYVTRVGDFRLADEAATQRTRAWLDRAGR